MMLGGKLIVKWCGQATTDGISHVELIALFMMVIYVIINVARIYMHQIVKNSKLSTVIMSVQKVTIGGVSCLRQFESITRITNDYLYTLFSLMFQILQTIIRQLLLIWFSSNLAYMCISDSAI